MFACDLVWMIWWRVCVVTRVFLWMIVFWVSVCFNVCILCFFQSGWMCMELKLTDMSLRMPNRMKIRLIGKKTSHVWAHGVRSFLSSLIGPLRILCLIVGLCSESGVQRHTILENHCRNRRWSCWQYETVVCRKDALIWDYDNFKFLNLAS